MKPNIRPYNECDLPVVLSTWESASAIAHPFLASEFLDQERSNIPNVYIPMAEMWVAEREGQVLGFVALIGNEVGAIFVKPENQRQGIGHALMDKARELRGNLEVEVFRANGIGRQFYAKYGFVPLNEKIHEPTGQKILRLTYRAT